MCKATYAFINCISLPEGFCLNIKLALAATFSNGIIAMIMNRTPSWLTQPEPRTEQPGHNPGNWLSHDQIHINSPKCISLWPVFCAILGGKRAIVFGHEIQIQTSRTIPFMNLSIRNSIGIVWIGISIGWDVSMRLFNHSTRRHMNWRQLLTCYKFNAHECICVGTYLHKYSPSLLNPNSNQT